MKKILAVIFVIFAGLAFATNSISPGESSACNKTVDAEKCVHISCNDGYEFDSCTYCPVKDPVDKKETIIDMIMRILGLKK